MKKMIITISRENGSGGHIISDLLGKKLAIKVYDREMLTQVAVKHGLAESDFRKADEKAPGFYITPYAPAKSDILYMAQTELIEELAKEEESCIIVGRCANAILKDNPDAFHIFIYAPMDFRIRSTMKHRNIQTPEEARKYIIKADKMRKSYYQYYTEYTWGGREGYDLLINSAVLGEEGTAQLIADIIRTRFA